MSERHVPKKHWTTPQRARLRDAVEHVKAGTLLSPGGTRVSQRRLFREYGIPQATAQRIIKDPDSRRLHNRKSRREPRGRKSKLSERDLRAVEHVIQSEGQVGRCLPWEALAFEANLDVSAQTLQQHCAERGYRRCISCRKGWITATIAAKRVQFAEEMLSKYPNPEDWDRVRFSDEVHLGFGPQGRIYVTRKPGEVYCADCVQHSQEVSRKDENKVHAWSWCSFGEKGRLRFYNTGTNSNGAITINTYLEILREEVAYWPSNAVLEQDGAKGHGIGKNSQVTKWLNAHNVSFYTNCPYSPDLAPIENCWLAPQAWLRKWGHWDEFSVREIATEGWNALSQAKVNAWCRSMPQRLRDVIKLKGQLTAY